MKYKVAMSINLALSILLVLVMMRLAYKSWIVYSPYTIGDLFLSVFIHGGLGVMFYLVVGWILRRTTLK